MKQITLTIKEEDIKDFVRNQLAWIESEQTDSIKDDIAVAKKLLYEDCSIEDIVECLDDARRQLAYLDQMILNCYESLVVLQSEKLNKMLEPIIMQQNAKKVENNVFESNDDNTNS